MEIKIKSNLSHEEYMALIDYIDKAGETRWGGTEIKKEPIYEILSIEKVSGNPPVYRDVTIDVREMTLDKFPEDRTKIRESFKGLIDLLYK